MAYQEGDTSPPHINVHNEVVTKLAEIDAKYDLNLVLPPQRNIGDTDHVKDHNLLTDALQAIDDWEAAGGGAPGAAVIGDATGAVTKSSFTGDGTNGDDGQAYDVYEFTGSGELIVTTPGMVDAVVVGGGGGGGTSGTADRAGGGGGAGAYVSDTLYLKGATLTVVAGAGGTSANDGTPSELDNYISLGGGAGGFTQGGGSALSGHRGGSGGGGCAGPTLGVVLPGSTAYISKLGNDGGSGSRSGSGSVGAGGGGGGAGANGNDYVNGSTGGVGGLGVLSLITGSPTRLAGGGGGGGTNAGGAGTDGGGAGSVSLTGRGENGSANSGGGGGATHEGTDTGNGGSGYVCVRVKVASESYPFRTETTAPRTAHAARIEDGIVRQVIVIPHLDDDDAKITEYCNRIGLPGVWVDTSYLGARRGKYAGVGDTFVPTKAGGEFVSPVTEEISTADLPGEEK